MWDHSCGAKILHACHSSLCIQLVPTRVLRRTYSYNRTEKGGRPDQLIQSYVMMVAHKLPHRGRLQGAGVLVLVGHDCTLSLWLVVLVHVPTTPSSWLLLVASEYKYCSFEATRYEYSTSRSFVLVAKCWWQVVRNNSVKPRKWNSEPTGLWPSQQNSVRWN